MKFSIYLNRRVFVKKSDSHTLIRIFSGTFWIVKYANFLTADNGDAQADVSLRLAQMSEVHFLTLRLVQKRAFTLVNFYDQLNRHRTNFKKNKINKKK